MSLHSLFTGMPRRPAPAPELAPANLALLGTTDARNPWRDPVIDFLHDIGYDLAGIYNPVITGRPWNPEIDGPNEIFQKLNARHILHYVGNRGDGELSAYSAHEQASLSTAREVGSFAVVFDGTGLSHHARKQLRTMKNDTITKVHDTAPYVFDSVGGSLGWIAERLELSEYLARYALRKAADAVDDTIADQLNGPNPGTIAARAQEAQYRKAYDVAQTIFKIMEEGPRDSYVFSAHHPLTGKVLTISGLDQTISGILAEKGWWLISDKDGGFGLRPIADRPTS